MKYQRLQEKITQYKSLFKGRGDVFAIRWEKADKSVSGYSPVCLNEWQSGKCIKLNKGKCRDCKNQQYTPLNDFYIEQHIRGYKTYGIYPLLNDNSSYLLAVDFDGANWAKDAVIFIEKCAIYKLPAYLERSQSGNGGHVWLFFKDKYPAHKSRYIAINILKEAKIIDQFDKEDSFDRLFPNQDYQSGKGFGNLIALPLQGKASQHNNTVYLDLENELIPFKNQWSLLQKIEKIQTSALDQLYKGFNQEIKIAKSNARTCLTITIKEQIHISKNNLPKIFIDFFKRKT